MENIHVSVVSKSDTPRSVLEGCSNKPLVLVDPKVVCRNSANVLFPESDRMVPGVALNKRSARKIYSEPGAYDAFIRRHERVALFARTVLNKYYENPHSIMYIGLIEFALNASRRLLSGSFCNAFERIV